MRTPRGLLSILALLAVGAGCKSGSGPQVVYRTLQSIAVEPASVTLHLGESETFTVRATYSDATTSQVLSATWVSSAPAVATVGLGRATGVSAGTATVTATFQGKTAAATVIVSPATLDSIDLSPLLPSVAAGLDQHFAATGNYSDTTQVDVSTRVTWASASPSIATISSQAGSEGLAHSLAEGSSEISATLGTVSASTTLTVTAPEVVSVAVSPSAASIISGETASFSAAATYTNHATSDVTATASWDSSTLDVATVAYTSGSTATATGVGEGSADISATIGGKTGVATLLVASSTPTAVELTPTAPSIASGTSVQLTATALYGDHSIRDVTADATWDSQTPAAVTVTVAGLASAVASGGSVVTASFRAVSGTTTVTATPAALSSLELTPAVVSIASGTQLQLSAIGHFGDGTRQDLTGQVSWSSLATGVAAISSAPGSAGVVSAVAPGLATIKAALLGIEGTAAVTVTAAQLQTLEVSPAWPSLPRGTSLQLHATGLYSDGSRQDLTSQVVWASTFETVATVSVAAGSVGAVRGVSTGTTVVSATAGAVGGSTTVTVVAATLSSVQVTPALPTLARGTSVALVATGVFSDGTTEDLTTQVTWASASAAVATVSNATGTQGLVTALATGTTSVRAQLRTTFGDTTITVTAPSLDALELSPAAPSLASGTSVQLHATAVWSDGSSQDVTDLVTWASGSAGVAAVSNVEGSRGWLVAGTAGGTTVSATLGGRTASLGVTVTSATLSSIDVTPPAPSLPRGSSLQLVATGLFSDGTVQDVTALATWSSSRETIAAVSNVPGSAGLVQSASTGPGTITAELDGIAGSTVVSVVSATLSSLQITPAVASIARGTTQLFTVAGVYSDGSVADLSTQVGWSSANVAVLSISSAAGSWGLATGVSPGTTTITARLGSVTGTAAVTVTSAVLTSLQLSPTGATVVKGSLVQLTAVGIYSDGSAQDLTTRVTWTSTDSTIVVVSGALGSRGLATATGVGVVTLTASVGTVSVSTTLSVTAAVLTTLDVLPVDPTAPRGTTLQFQAVGTFSDGTSQDLTTQVTWTTSSPSTAPVSNAAGTQGLATALAAGQTIITATRGGITDYSTLTVSAARLTDLTLAPANASLARGTTLQLAATGTFADGTTQDLTTQVTWSSSDPGKLSVSNSTGLQGLATALTTGGVTITAVAFGQTATTLLTVTGATLTSIGVTPLTITVPVGYKAAFTATGTYSDGTKQDLTTRVTWLSSATAVASVSNASGSKGVATVVGGGTANITASLSGTTGQATLTGSTGALSSIAVTPATVALSAGQTQKMVATGTFTDATTLDLTAQVIWKSSQKRFAMIATSGVVTAKKKGASTITATKGTKAGSALVTVQ